LSDLFRFETVDSTNDQALRQLAIGSMPPFGVVADQQTAGRGRQGRSWISEATMGIYLTHVELVAEVPTPLTLAPLAVGCGVADWLATLGLAVRLKWPNDLRVERAKIGGVLCEVRSQALLVGVGVNWFAAPELDQQRTTHVQAHRVGVIELPEAQRGLHNAVTGAFRWWRQQGNEALRERWWGLAERGRVSTDSWVGEPLGVAEDGALRLRDEAGAVHHIRAGDVEDVNS
jgi:BirA family biotin operon repressor/biotin-[acetyl-CoA-carboxylase] ligase